MLQRVTPSEGIQRKYPEWVVLVGTRDKDGQPNVMPAGWCMCTSGDPLMMAVSIKPSCYTHQCIEQTGEFILAWAGEGQAELIEYAGSTSGQDINKFDDYPIEYTEADETDLPLILGCHAHLECKLVSQMITGDHTIFAGVVVAAYLPEPPIPKLENFEGKFAVASSPSTANPA